MAPPKRKTGGRTTPAGTRPSDSARAGTATAGRSGDGGGHHHESGRYTAPISRAERESPPWVPALMLGLLIAGAVLIILRYLVWDDTNVPMVIGMACLLGGLYTGTKWR